MGKKRTSAPSAAALPAQGSKISFDDDHDFDAEISVPASAPAPAPAAAANDSDSDDDSDDAPEAVGLSSVREAERAREAAAAA